MALAIIGGMPDKFAPLVQYYRDNAAHAGHDLNSLQVGINSFTWIAETSQQATKEFTPRLRRCETRLGRERGWAPMTYEHYVDDAFEDRVVTRWQSRKKLSTRSFTNTSSSNTLDIWRRWALAR